MFILSMLSSEADHVLCGADTNKAQTYTVSCYCEVNPTHLSYFIEVGGGGD